MYDGSINPKSINSFESVQSNWQAVVMVVVVGFVVVMVTAVVMVVVVVGIVVVMVVAVVMVVVVLDIVVVMVAAVGIVVVMVVAAGTEPVLGGVQSVTAFQDYI